MSIYDRAAGHFRRYPKDTLSREFDLPDFPATGLPIAI